MKRYLELFIIILCAMFISGCKDKDMDDSVKFKNEYEKIEVDENNNIKYIDIDEVTKMVDNGTGVVYFGNNDDDLSLTAVPILLSASDSTNLKNIYYVNTKDIEDEFIIKDNDDNLIISNDVINVPLVLFIYNGNILSYHIGTIDNRVELSDDEAINLYNIYLTGIHSVLNDQCSSDKSGEEHC